MRIRMYIAAIYGVAAVAASGLSEALTMRTHDEALGGQLEVVSEAGTHAAEVLQTDFDVRIRGDVSEVHLRQIFAPLSGAGDATYYLPIAEQTELVAIEIAQGARIQRRGLASTGRAAAASHMFSQDLKLAGDLPVGITLIYRQPVRIDEAVHSITLPIAGLRDGWTPTEFVHPEFEDLPEYLRGETMLTEPLNRSRIDIRVSIDRPALQEIYSDSHEIDVTAVEGGRIVELAAGEYVANRAFTLTFVPDETGMTQVANIERTR